MSNIEWKTALLGREGWTVPEGCWMAMMRYMNELRVRINWQEGQSSKV